MMTREMNDDTLKNLLSPSVSDRKGTDLQRLVANDVITAKAATSGSISIVNNGVGGRIGVDAETVRPSSGSGRLESPMECPRRTAASVFGNTIGRLVTLASPKLRMVLSMCVAAPTVIEFSASKRSKVGMKEPRTPAEGYSLQPMRTHAPASQVSEAHGSSEGQVAEVRGR